MSSYVDLCADFCLERGDATSNGCQVSETCPYLYKRGEGQRVSGDLGVGGWKGLRGNTLGPSCQACIWTPDFFRPRTSHDSLGYPWATQEPRSKRGRKTQVPGRCSFRVGVSGIIHLPLVPLAWAWSCSFFLRGRIPAGASFEPLSAAVFYSGFQAVLP